MKDFNAPALEYQEGAKALNSLIPETWQAFTSLVTAGSNDAVIPRKYKELISVAIGIAGKRDGCIALHPKAQSMLARPAKSLPKWSVSPC